MTGIGKYSSDWKRKAFCRNPLKLHGLRALSSSISKSRGLCYECDRALSPNKKGRYSRDRKVNRK